MNKKYISLISIVVSLGALLLLLLWYGYLQRSASTGSFEKVFSSYSPQASGGNTAGKALQTRKNAPAANPQSPPQNARDAAPHTEGKKIADTAVGGGSDILGVSVRYVDRAKGYVYQTNLATGESKRISNIVLPGAFDIRFTSQDNAIVQTLDDRGTTIAHALTFTADGSAVDTTIPLALIDIATTPTQDTVYALARDENGGVVLVSFPLPYTPDTTPTRLWTSSLAQWRLRASQAGQLVLTQKASNGIPGYSYLFNQKTKKLEKLEGDTPALQTLPSPSGAYTLITRADGEEVHTHLLTMKTRSSIELSRITLPEKCVWETTDGLETGVMCGFPKQIPRRDLPDIWYQGGFIFDDTLGRVDLATGAITEVDMHLDVPVDMTDLHIGAHGTALIFTDKTTGALWTVKNI